MQEIGENDRIFLEKSDGVGHCCSCWADIHESYPLLKEKLKPADKCWKTEIYEIIEAFEVCTKEEIFGHNPLVCVARGEFRDQFVNYCN